MAFTDHLEQPGQKSKATESLWWKTAIGHMQYILMTVRVGSLCRLFFGGGGVCVFSIFTRFFYVELRADSSVQFHPGEAGVHQGDWQSDPARLQRIRGAFELIWAHFLWFYVHFSSPSSAKSAKMIIWTDIQCVSLRWRGLMYYFRLLFCSARVKCFYRRLDVFCLFFRQKIFVVQKNIAVFTTALCQIFKKIRSKRNFVMDKTPFAKKPTNQSINQSMTHQ